MRKSGILSSFVLAVALGFASAPAVHAETLEERVVAALQAQGYEIVEIGYTWFGRLRVVGENAEYRREMVFNPGTGEVLRDYSSLLAFEDTAPANSSGSSSVRVTATAGSTGGNGGRQPASVPKPVP